MNESKVKVITLGFSAWKTYEKAHGRTSIDEIAKRAEMSIPTARAFIAEDHAIVDGAQIIGAGKICRLFGISFDELLQVVEDAE